MQKTGAVLLGISPDTPKAQKKFQEKYDLPFTLLADANKTVAAAFGVMKEKNMYGKKVWGIERTTFLIGPDQTLLHIFPKVTPEGHAEEVLTLLKEWKKSHK
jgi:peroxiredoxin Q/BCP